MFDTMCLTQDSVQRVQTGAAGEAIEWGGGDGKVGGGERVQMPSAGVLQVAAEEEYLRVRAEYVGMGTALTSHPESLEDLVRLMVSPKEGSLCDLVTLGPTNYKADTDAEGELAGELATSFGGWPLFLQLYEPTRGDDQGLHTDAPVCLPTPLAEEVPVQRVSVCVCMCVCVCRRGYRCGSAHATVGGVPVRLRELASWPMYVCMYVCMYVYTYMLRPNTYVCMCI